MKQYHYEELQNVNDLNYFQQIQASGHMYFIITLVVASIIGAILSFICFKIEKKKFTKSINERSKFNNWHLHDNDNICVYHNTNS